MSSNQMCEVDMEPNPPKFNCGFDLGSLAVGSDVAYHSWLKITESRNTLVPKSGTKSVEFKEFELGKFNIVALASSPTPQFLQNNGGLVSYEELDEFKFLCSKTNPKFAINRAAVLLFRSARGQLSNLRDKIVGSAKSIPYIITGHGMGGSVAALFTLWLLDSLDPSTTKRPLCVTFGSPLVGDGGFQEAVSQCSPWNSCFLHVVHKQDNTPNLFDSKLHSPFGTYLFCSDSGFACFEASASASAVLKEMKTDNHGGGDGVIEEFDYGPVIDRLRGNAIYKDTRNLTVSGGGIIDSFKIGIEAQLAAIGFQEHMRLVKQIVEDEVDARKTEAMDPSRKLNYMKMELAKFEWYKKRTAMEGVGYYDSFKNMLDTKDDDMVLLKKTLDTYWENIMREVTRKPQKATGEKLRKSWNYDGSVYRGLIEPLHIAEYYKYKKVGRSYLADERPGFLRELEELAKELSKQSNKEAPTLEERRQRMMGYNMNEDSCFWAHVEEAKLSCESLLTGLISDDSDNNNKKVLEEFEKYCIEQIDKHGVSREIFLKKSTYFKWWELYMQVLEKNQIMGPDYKSPLIAFMRADLFEDYIKGTYKSLSW